MLVSSYQPPVIRAGQPSWGGWERWGGNMGRIPGGVSAPGGNAPTAPRAGTCGQIDSARPPRRGAGRLVQGRKL